MFRGDWGSKFALVGIALALFSGGATLAKELQQVRIECPPLREQTNKSSRSIAQRECYAHPVVILETPAQASSAKEREQSQDRYHSADLKAQQDAADGAQRAAATAERQEVPAWMQIWLASVGTVVAAIALIFSIISERRNRKATQEQLRAYVLLETFKLSVKTWHQDINTPFMILEPHIVLKNFGQSLASDLTISMRFAIWDMPHIGADFPPLDPIEARNSRSLLGPGAVANLSTAAISLTIPEFELLLGGMKKAYVWGVADYVDIFGENQTLTFRVATGDFVRGDVIPLSPCAEGNSSTPHRAKRHRYFLKWL